MASGVSAARAARRLRLLGGALAGGLLVFSVLSSRTGFRVLLLASADHSGRHQLSRARAAFCSADSVSIECAKLTACDPDVFAPHCMVDLGGCRC